MLTARLTKQIKKQQGFTLIELLVVIGILAVLLAITLIAINPAKQFSQSNNTKRRSDVNAILNAIDQYAADNAGKLPTGIPSAGAVDIGNGAGQADLCDLLVTTYLAALPSDPKTGNPPSQVDKTKCTAAGGTYDTGYQVVQNVPDNRVSVSAPQTELGVPVITVTR